MKTLTHEETQGIFAKMQVRYGRSFDEKWRDIPLEALYSDWAEMLGDYTGDTEALTYALRHMPPAFPPTAMEFLQLCEKAAALRDERERAEAQEEYERLMTPDGNEWVWDGGRMILMPLGSGMRRAPVPPHVRERAKALMTERGKAAKVTFLLKWK